MVLGPENGEQEAEEKHHQAKANKADDWKETHTHVQIVITIRPISQLNRIKR